MKRTDNIDKNGVRRVKFGVELERKIINSGWGTLWIVGQKNLRKFMDTKNPLAICRHTLHRIGAVHDPANRNTYVDKYHIYRYQIFSRTPTSNHHKGSIASNPGPISIHTKTSEGDSRMDERSYHRRFTASLLPVGVNIARVGGEMRHLQHHRQLLVRGVARGYLQHAVPTWTPAYVIKQQGSATGKRCPTPPPELRIPSNPKHPLSDSDPTLIIYIWSIKSMFNDLW